MHYLTFAGLALAWALELSSSDSHGTDIRTCAADQWDVQPTIQRLNELLLARGYATWFDLTNMKGSTMDAMSDAIEG